MASSHKEIQSQLVLYAKSLLERTLDGQIEWRPTDDNSSFRFSGKNSGAIIHEADDMFAVRGRKQYTLSILNSDGISVADLETDTPNRLENTSRPAADWNDDLEELFNAAKRIALKVDEVLKVAFDDLP
jgi:hypothetical protein